MQSRARRPMSSIRATPWRRKRSSGMRPTVEASAPVPAAGAGAGAEGTLLDHDLPRRRATERGGGEEQEVGSRLRLRCQAPRNNPLSGGGRPGPSGRARAARGRRSSSTRPHLAGTGNVGHCVEVQLEDWSQLGGRLVPAGRRPAPSDLCFDQANVRSARSATRDHDVRRARRAPGSRRRW